MYICPKGDDRLRPSSLIHISKQELQDGIDSEQISRDQIVPRAVQKWFRDREGWTEDRVRSENAKGRTVMGRCVRKNG